MNTVCATFLASMMVPIADPLPQYPFDAPTRREIPTFTDAGDQKWVRNPLDSFILKKMKESGVKPAPEAPSEVLLRRLFVDLTGLPPNLDDQSEFTKDSSLNAYEKWVDRLLERPQYAERMAQHWLDLVRFAESNGYETDGERPHFWRYRDYVTDAFLKDKPYSQFLTEQLAGDLLASGKTPRESVELLAATGLHRCGPQHVVSGNLDKEVLRQEVLLEMVQGLSAIMGLTVNCARCHDHKFDPITQADYYRLEAFFARTQFTEIDFATKEEKAAHTKTVTTLTLKMAPIKAKIAAFDNPARKKAREIKISKLDEQTRKAIETPDDKRTPEQKKLAKDAEGGLKILWDEVLEAMSPDDREKRAKLRTELIALQEAIPQAPSIVSCVEESKPTASYVLKRGEVHRKLGPVSASVPVVFGGKPSDTLGHSLFAGGVSEIKALDRLDLAKWLTDPKHPLTSRVYVNRLWMQFFGKGIVSTTGDFGKMGESPTHPELLDFLATELHEKKGSTKAIVKMIVMSNAYRQSSIALKETIEKDPDNKLFSRMNRKRLDGESLRDHMLFIGDALNTKQGGPSVKVPLEPEVYDLIFTEGEPDGLWPVTPDPTEHRRRSIYLFNKRNVRYPLFEAFDQPDRLFPCPARIRSTSAPQSLILMNGPITNTQAGTLSRVLVTRHKDPSEIIEEAYRRVLCRMPTKTEKGIATQFFTDQIKALKANDKAILLSDVPKGADPVLATVTSDFCRVLFNLNEFVYLK